MRSTATARNRSKRTGSDDAQTSSRVPGAGADFKEMAIRWLIRSGAEIERLDFEIDDIPVDAQMRGSSGRTFLVIILVDAVRASAERLQKDRHAREGGVPSGSLGPLPGPTSAACHVGSP